ncbi:hypothetical protein A584_28081, partial [Pseudomonas syringae pv. theae ICMP 3923]
MFSDSLYSLVGTVLAFAGIFSYFTGLLIRQKTIYNYIAVAVIMIFVFIALLTGSLLFLIGPVAMAFIAAVKLLNWEN